MSLINGLRVWWQKQTGEEETPLDGDTPGFFVSLVVHLVAFLTLAYFHTGNDTKQVTLTLTTTPAEEEIAELLVPADVFHNDLPSDKVGANSNNSTEMALSVAPIVSPDTSDIPSPVEANTTALSEFTVNNLLNEAVGLNFNKNLTIKGAVGAGEHGASGAVDRITAEILRSMEERKTLVVWLFDSTASLKPQRKQIMERFDRIYKELGILEAANNKAFEKHDHKPLLTSIVAFGDKINLMTKTPTDNLAELKKAVDSIEDDGTGRERVFSAVHATSNWYKTLRIPDDKTRQPDRNVLLIVFTDEAGSDIDEKFEQAVQTCRRYEMPVYVVGVPAPFGRKETLVKWVDPDPNFDQSPKWGRVDQGPESYLPERIKLSFSGGKNDDDPIDSGFGPFALTRLCYETGGIYFAVHPNRNVNRAVTRGETTEFSAHIKYFFDAEVMRKYRPDYVSADEYKRRVSSNKARLALVQAAESSKVDSMESPTLRFVKRSEAEMANALTEAQKDAAKIEPKIQTLYEMLARGESDREKESSLRWQAGFDLAMGRVLAVKVRTEAYNGMLAKAKRGMVFKNAKNNTWILEPADEVSVDSKLEKLADRAKMYLNRVVTDHPGTPWALLAKRELDDKVGWTWKEEFTDLNPRREGMGNGNNTPPANDKKNMVKKPLPSRPPPPL